MGEGARSRRAGVVAEPKPQDHRPPRPARPSPPGDGRRVRQIASNSSGRRRRRPNADCEPNERRPGPVRTPRRSRLLATAWRCWPAARPEHLDDRDLGQRRDLADGPIPPGCRLLRGGGPTLQRVSTGGGKGTRPRGCWLDHQQAVGLQAGAARHLQASTLVRATPTVTRRPTRRGPAAQAPGDLLRRARDPPRAATSMNASSSEGPSTQARSRGTRRTTPGSPRCRRWRAWPGRTRLRAQAKRPAAAIPPLTPYAPGALMKAGHHRTWPERRSGRPRGLRSSQRLDRREECVGVGVQNRRASPAGTYVRVRSGTDAKP